MRCILIITAYEYIPDSEIATVSAATTTTETSCAGQSTIEADATGPSGSSEEAIEEHALRSEEATPHSGSLTDAGTAPKFICKLFRQEVGVGDCVMLVHRFNVRANLFHWKQYILIFKIKVEVSSHW